MTPHIRVLRALAVNIQHESDSAAKAEGSPWAPRQIVRFGLFYFSRALEATADQLEAEEPRLHDDDHPITYDPKGKR